MSNAAEQVVEEHKRPMLRVIESPKIDKANNVVETDSLIAHYGEFAALKSISMAVPRNSITALIGPSGCGKSTFLRTLNRMNDDVSNFSVEGKVIIDGIDVYSRETNVVELRSKVGMVFQRPNPFPMSIIDNVTWALRRTRRYSKGELMDIAVESLQQAGLWGEVGSRLKDPAVGLSGGQQQRLCIARAIALRPSLLLMDEPTSALDPASTKVIEELMLSLRENYTVILVSHNMQQAARVSDMTGFFLHGELVEYGPTEQVFSNPRDRRTEDYITGRFG